MTVAVDVVVRKVVDVASAVVVVVVAVVPSDDSVGVGRKTGFVRLADCVVSGAVVGAGGAWLEVLAWAVDELEADEAVEDGVGSMGADDVKNTASLVVVVVLGVAEFVVVVVVVVAAVGLDDEAAPSVELELAGSAADVVDTEVTRVVPACVEAEVRLLPPVDASEALVLCGG